MPDAVVVGSGPNGLSAAIVLAQAGLEVVVLEAHATPGGGARSAALTLPGFVHDTCSAVYPFGAVSPFWNTLPLAAHRLAWVQPAVQLAHPFDGGGAVALDASLDDTVSALGGDGRAYADSIGAVARQWPRLEPAILGPLRVPRHPVTLARFALRALQSAASFGPRTFAGEPMRATFAGLAAHSMLPLDRALTAGVGLTLGALCHVSGWPVAHGGAQSITTALVAHLTELGGTVVTGSPVASIDDLPPSAIVMCDLSPRPLLRLAGHRFPPSYRRLLETYRYGPAAFKMDWALSEPIPWTAPVCRQAATLHLGGTSHEITGSEQQVWRGGVSERPFVLLSQPTVCDPSRAPQGRHVAWAYCHVPPAAPADMTERIERQIERFAPGFRDCILARAVTTPQDLEAQNPNYVGGDIAAGVVDLPQFFTRPTWRTYRTPLKKVFICSASTPPGVGVHGMCGFHAARAALQTL